MKSCSGGSRKRWLRRRSMRSHGSLGGTLGQPIPIGWRAWGRLLRLASDSDTTPTSTPLPTRCETHQEPCWEWCGEHWMLTRGPSTATPVASTWAGFCSTTAIYNEAMWWSSVKEPWTLSRCGVSEWMPWPSTELVWEKIRSDSLTDWTLSSSSLRTTMTTLAGRLTATPNEPSPTVRYLDLPGRVRGGRTWASSPKIA